MQTANKGQDIIIKLVILLGMLLVMLIPIFMIQCLIGDRERNRTALYEELTTENWGGVSIIESPYLFNKLKYKAKDNNKLKIASVEAYVRNNELDFKNPNIIKIKTDQISDFQDIVFHPKKMDVITDIHTQVLKRGIYNVQVFSADIIMNVEFNSSSLKLIDDISKEKNICLFMPINDVKLQGGVSATLNGVELSTDISKYSVVGDNSAQNKGLEFIVSPEMIENNETLKFEIKFRTLGSQEMSFSPLASETTVKAVSSWTSPSFFGDILPAKRSVGLEGFEVEWSDAVIGASVNSTPNKFGVKFLTPVDYYRLTERSTKYAFLFIALTFLAFFITEIMGKLRIHPVQYLLVGAAMVLFYSLLLSFTEQMGFTLAYIISATGTISLISGYTFTILRNKKSSGFITALLIILYFFLYLILHMEEYSLIAGSILLFIGLGFTMYILRNVNWYEETTKE